MYFLGLGDRIANVSYCFQHFLLASLYKDIESTPLHHDRSILPFHIIDFEFFCAYQPFIFSFFLFLSVLFSFVFFRVHFDLKFCTNIYNYYKTSNHTGLWFLRSTFFTFLTLIIFFMNSPEQIKCNQCLVHFTTSNPAFAMPTCQHNICSKCLAEIWQN